MDRHNGKTATGKKARGDNNSGPKHIPVNDPMHECNSAEIRGDTRNQRASNKS